MSPDVEQGFNHVRRLVRAQTTSCYLVNGDYTKELYKTFLQSLYMLKGTSRIPRHTPKDFNRHADGLFRGSIDIHWWPLMNSGRWWALHPSGGRQMVSFSDIDGHVVNYSAV